MPVTVTVDAINVAIGSTVIPLGSVSLMLSEGYNTIYATVAGIAATTNDIVRNDTTVPLYGITVVNGVIQGTTDLRPQGGIDLSKYVYGTLPLGNNSTAVQNTVNPGGGVSYSNPLNTGTVSYTAQPAQFTATISPTLDPASSSYIGYSTVATAQVQAVAIVATQLSQTQYDTTALANLANNAASYLWRSTANNAAIPSTTVIANGDTLVYDVQSYSDVGTHGPVPDRLTLAAGAVSTLEFDHAPYHTGSAGLNTIVFVGNSVSQGANVLSSNAISASDQPTITHSTAANYQNTQESTSIGSFSSQPTITVTTHQNYATNQHNSGYLNAGSLGVTSTATISGVAAVNAVSVNLACTLNAAAEPTPSYSKRGTPVTFTLGITKQPSASYPATLTASCTDPRYGSPVYVDVFDGAGASMGQTFSLTSAQPNLVVTFVDGAPGTWQVVMYNENYSNSPLTNHITGSLTGYAPGQNFVSTAGQARILYALPPSTLPPTSPLTQINLHISNIAYPGDANGSGAMSMYIATPGNTKILQVWHDVQANTDYTYYDSAATGGAYAILIYAEIATNNGTGPGSYTPNIDTSGFSWYQLDEYNTYTFNDAIGSYAAYATGPATIAPTSAATAVSLAITSVTAQTIGANSSNLYGTLYNPAGVIVLQGPVITPGTFSYSDPNAAAGSYTWILAGYISNDAQTLTTSQSFTVTATGSIAWYESINHPITSYFENAGLLYLNATPTATLAPTSAATQLSFNVTSVITPANMYGATFLETYLLDPNGNAVQFQFSYDGGNTWNFIGPGSLTSDGTINQRASTQTPVLYRYFAPSAIAGAYTWCTYGFPRSALNGDSAYAVSWNATYSCYLVGVSGGNVYVLAADGVTQRSATNDANIAFVQQSPSRVAFKVGNNAGVPLSFTIAVVSLGV